MACFDNGYIIRSCFDRLVALKDLGPGGIRKERLALIKSAPDWLPLIASTIDIDARDKHNQSVAEQEEFRNSAQAQLTNKKAMNADGSFRIDGAEFINRTSMIDTAQRRGHQEAVDDGRLEVLN